MDLLVKESLNTSVQDLVSAFLSGRKQTTIQSYKQDLQHFSRFLQVADLNEAAAILLNLQHGQANALVLKYKVYLIDQLKLQSATVNRQLSALRSLVKLARTMGLVSWTLEIENQKHESYRDVRGIGESGIKAMLQSIENGTDLKSIRDCSILRLLFDLGLRRNEVCELDLTDVNLEQGTLAVLGKGKSNKELLSLPQPTIDALKKWIGLRGFHEGALFFRLDRASNGSQKRLTGTGLYSIIKELGSKAGIKTTVHKIRHTSITACAQAIAENNLGIESVLKFSRHKNLNTALIYFDHLEDKQGKLASLVAKKAS